MERHSGQFSRDGTTANLMKMLSEVIVAVAFEPYGKITRSTKRNEFSLESLSEEILKMMILFLTVKERKRKRTGKKEVFCFLLLRSLNNEAHRQEGRVTG